MSKKLRFLLLVAGILLLIVAATALWYGLAPTGVQSVQETLSPTQFVVPTP